MNLRRVNPSPPRQIAIDGPVASGKTVVGRLLAQRLGYRFLDTGLMYRAITWLALKENIPLEEEALAKLARSMCIRIADEGKGNTHIIVNNQDVTGQLRISAVEAAVSPVSTVQGLREVMVQHQRDVAHEAPIVMVGRDIGTVVLPKAGLKIFLHASVPVRAQRRYRELIETGSAVSYEAVLSNLEERDRIDSQRDQAPLRPADDAHILDTDDIGVDEVVEQIISLLDGANHEHPV
jgi:cytidylate kinase